MTAPDTITTGDGRTIQLSELEAKARAATPGPRRFIKRVQLRPGSRKYHCPREDGEEPICGTVNGTIVVKTEGGVFCASDESHIATFDRETCLALIAEVRRQTEDIASLREWKSSILNALKTVPEFETGKWAGDKEGWGFCFEFIHWMRREIASLRERVAELEVGHGTTSIRPVFPIQPEDMP